MKTPFPRRSRFNPAVPESLKDYSMTSPLLMDGSNFPCKGYAKGATVATYAAGSNIAVEMSGSVFHSGGHCQFSVSYDDNTYVVLKTVMKNCFVGTGLTFQVPLPAGTPPCTRCTFSWTWVNAIGNREFYMNCADIKITNTLPNVGLIGKKMVVANLPSYPQVPESPPSAYDGSDLYSKAPTITVGASGSVPTTTRTTTTSTSSTPRPTTSFCATRTVTVVRIVTAR